VQEECILTPPQSVLDLLQKVKHIHSSIPFRSKHELAQQVYEKQIEPLPAPAPVQDIQVSKAPAAAASSSAAPAPTARRDRRPPREELSSVNVGYVVGPIAAATLLVLGVVAVAVFVRRQRAKSRSRWAKASGSRVHSKVCINDNVVLAVNALPMCCPANNGSGTEQEQ
jgi:hypothetical protein